MESTIIGRIGFITHGMGRWRNSISRIRGWLLHFSTRAFLQRAHLLPSVRQLLSLLREGSIQSLEVIANLLTEIRAKINALKNEILQRQARGEERPADKEQLRILEELEGYLKTIGETPVPAQEETHTNRRENKPPRDHLPRTQVEAQSIHTVNLTIENHGPKTDRTLAAPHEQTVVDEPIPERAPRPIATNASQPLEMLARMLVRALRQQKHDQRTEGMEPQQAAQRAEKEMAREIELLNSLFEKQILRIERETSARTRKSTLQSRTQNDPAIPEPETVPSPEPMEAEELVIQVIPAKAGKPSAIKIAGRINALDLHNAVQKLLASQPAEYLPLMVEALTEMMESPTPQPTETKPADQSAIRWTGEMKTLFRSIFVSLQTTPQNVGDPIKVVLPGAPESKPAAAPAAAPLPTTRAELIRTIAHSDAGQRYILQAFTANQGREQILRTEIGRELVQEAVRVALPEAPKAQPAKVLHALTKENHAVIPNGKATAETATKILTAAAAVQRCFVSIEAVRSAQAQNLHGNIPVAQVNTKSAPRAVPAAKQRQVIAAMRELAQTERETGMIVPETVRREICTQLASAGLMPPPTPQAQAQGTSMPAAPADTRTPNLQRIVEILQRQVVNDVAPEGNTPTAPTPVVAAARNIMTKQTAGKPASFVLTVQVALERFLGVIYQLSGANKHNATIIENILRKYEILEIYVKLLQKSGESAVRDQFLCELVLLANIYVQEHAAAHSPKSLEHAISLLAKRRRNTDATAPRSKTAAALHLAPAA